MELFHLNKERFQLSNQVFPWLHELRRAFQIVALGPRGGIKPCHYKMAVNAKLCLLAVQSQYS